MDLLYTFHASGHGSQILNRFEEFVLDVKREAQKVFQVLVLYRISLNFIVYSNFSVLEIERVAG